jgi:hypothetical protein
MIRYFEGHVGTLGINDVGFSPRATLLANAAWMVGAALIVWVLIRFAKAPRTIALYLVCAGLMVAGVTVLNRLALNWISMAAGSEYARSALSDLQPLVLALFEAIGVTIGAWIAAPREVRAVGLFASLGWTGRPLDTSAYIAVSFALARGIGMLVVSAVQFIPNAYSTFHLARKTQMPFDPPAWMITIAIPFIIYFLLGYLGVYEGIKRFRLPVSVWIIFAASSVPTIVAALMFLPAQLTSLSSSGVLGHDLVLAVLWSVAWPVSLLPVFLGVWWATRADPLSQPSGTLPDEVEDSW